MESMNYLQSVAFLPTVIDDNVETDFAVRTTCNMNSSIDNVFGMFLEHFTSNVSSLKRNHGFVTFPLKLMTCQPWLRLEGRIDAGT